MAMWGSKEYNQVFENYKKGQQWLSDVQLEIVGGEAEVDPLMLLRVYEDKISVDNELMLATSFCLNRTLRFHKNGQMIFETTYEGGDIGEKFRGYPFLLDILLKMSYGLMLKKLTPPSEDSESEERQ